MPALRYTYHVSRLCGAGKWREATFTVHTTQKKRTPVDCVSFKAKSFESREALELATSLRTTSSWHLLDVGRIGRLVQNACLATVLYLVGPVFWCRIAGLCQRFQVGCQGCMHDPLLIIIVRNLQTAQYLDL